MAEKTVLITGTSSGIGAACVARQAAGGWKVYAGVRKPEDGQRLVESVGGDVEPVILDVTNRAHIDNVLGQIEADVGRLDGLVNNAGITVGGPVELVLDEDWRRQFEVNFFALVTLTRQAFPLVNRANGRFVHIGSVAGRVVPPGLGPYGASKHAVAALNWSLRAELGRNTTVTSSVVEPGPVKTAVWDKAEQQVEDLDALLADPVHRARYRLLLDGLRGFIEEGRRRGVDADEVAQAVEHALTARRPKARYLVGQDARVIGLITRLPDRVREGLLLQFAKRYEKVGRS